MGYTHHFGFNNVDLSNNLNKEKFKMSVEIFKECMKYFPTIKLCNWNGEGNPNITNDGIILNGDKTNGFHYETFHIGLGNMNGFCKTARQPYDIAVCCALLSFKEIFEDKFNYYSDGRCMTDYDNTPKEQKKSFIFENEWINALQVFKKALNDYFVEEYESYVFHKKLKNLPKKKVI